MIPESEFYIPAHISWINKGGDYGKNPTNRI